MLSTGARQTPALPYTYLYFLIFIYLVGYKNEYLIRTDKSKHLHDDVVGVRLVNNLKILH